MSAKPVVLAVRTFPPAVEARLVRDYDAIISADDVVPGDGLPQVLDAHQAEAVLIAGPQSLTAEIIAALPDRVRAAASFGVGFDHIDVAAAKARGLIVTNTPDVLNDATADTAFLLLMGVARRAHEGEALGRAGQWHSGATTAMLGHDVTGKTLGIVGMGRIGRALAKRARGFDMQVHYHNRSRLTADLEQGATYHPDPATMLPLCDFLSLHCPSTPDTHHWLNADRMAQLPAGAFVVNTSRGPVVDENALVAALDGHLGGAGLDVYEQEPTVHPGLIAAPNTFLLPHLGSATVETRDAMGFCCLDNLDAIFAGKEPPNRIA